MTNVVFEVLYEISPEEYRTVSRHKTLETARRAVETLAKRERATAPRKDYPLSVYAIGYAIRCDGRFYSHDV